MHSATLPAAAKITGNTAAAAPGSFGEKSASDIIENRFDPPKSAPFNTRAATLQTAATTGKISPGVRYAAFLFPPAETLSAGTAAAISIISGIYMAIYRKWIVSEAYS